MIDARFFTILKGLNSDGLARHVRRLGAQFARSPSSLAVELEFLLILQRIRYRRWFNNILKTFNVVETSRSE